MPLNSAPFVMAVPLDVAWCAVTVTTGRFSIGSDFTTKSAAVAALPLDAASVKPSAATPIVMSSAAVIASHRSVYTRSAPEKNGLLQFVFVDTSATANSVCAGSESVNVNVMSAAFE